MEVQVKVLDWLLTVRSVTLGEPAWRYKQKVQMKCEARENLKVAHWQLITKIRLGPTNKIVTCKYMCLYSMLWCLELTLCV